MSEHSTFPEKIRTDDILYIRGNDGAIRLKHTPGLWLLCIACSEIRLEENLTTMPAGYCPPGFVVFDYRHCNDKPECEAKTQKIKDAAEERRIRDYALKRLTS